MSNHFHPRVEAALAVSPSTALVATLLQLGFTGSDLDVQTKLKLLGGLEQVGQLVLADVPKVDEMHHTRRGRGVA